MSVPFEQELNGLVKSDVVLAGTVKLTGATKQSGPFTYSQVAVTATRPMYGNLPGGIAYVLGGSAPDGTVTEVTSTRQSAWSTSDGAFWGVVSDQNGMPVLQALPILGDKVVFLSIGCWNPPASGAQTSVPAPASAFTVFGSTTTPNILPAHKALALTDVATMVTSALEGTASASAGSGSDHTAVPSATG